MFRYAQKKYIYAVNIMGKYYISKHSIINYLATDKAFRNTQKSEFHENLILKLKTNRANIKAETIKISAEFYLIFMPF